MEIEITGFMEILHHYTDNFDQTRTCDVGHWTENKRYSESTTERFRDR